MSQAADMIYLDSNATTCVDPAVVQEMLPYLTDFYGNPSSGYRFGQRVNEALEIARARTAALIDCAPEEIIFTSCGTESTNAALHSALQMDRDRQHIITTRVEHSATLKSCEALAKRGYEITWLGVNQSGQIDLAELERSIRDETAVVSIMWANNETGVVFPIQEISNIVREKGAVFHTDAVQAVGKIPITLADAKINLLSISGHKLHCPKGIGALYVNRRTRFFPSMLGGGQENGKRAGTQNVANIVALGKACELAGTALEKENTAVKKLRDDFEAEILKRIPDVQVNGDLANRLPNTSSLAFAGVESEAALILLDQAGICCSAGSACTTGQHEPSHVLRAMGFDDTRARSSLRFSFSHFNTGDEITRALQIIPGVIEKVRKVNVSA